MVPSNDKRDTLLPVFAPSPPLSTSASGGASDCDADTHPAARRTLHAQPEEGSRGRLQAHQPGDASSPPSFTSEPSIHTRPRPIAPASSSSESDFRSEEEASTRAFSLIRASWKGRLPDDVECPEWHVLHITSSQYSQLRQRLEEEDPRLLKYFESVLRFDYDPARGVLVLRLMASSLHDALQDAISFHIRTLLAQVATDTKDPVLAQLASDVISTGHAKVKLVTGANMSPDGQLHFRKTRTSARRPYEFKGSRYPQFVMEIGYSQKAQSLQWLAKEYYEGSKGRIKTVLTVKVEYAYPEKRVSVAEVDRSASFCLYRGPERIAHNIGFRDARGNVLASTGHLRLVLADFIPDNVLQQLSSTLARRAESTTIIIPAETLCQFLTVAEEAQELADEESGSSESTPGLETEAAEDGSAPQASRKRKVQWDLDVDGVGAGGGIQIAESRPESGASEASGSALRSKRRRTGLSEVDDEFGGLDFEERHSRASPSRTMRITRSRSRRRSEAGGRDSTLGSMHNS